MYSEEDEDEEEDEKNTLDHIVNVFSHFARMAFSVKNVNMSYDETNGSMLPGFKPTSEFFGMAQRFSPNSAPGWRYLLGGQPEELDLNRFASNGWITSDTLLNQPFTKQYTSRLNIRSNVEPIKKLRIQITAQRSETINTSSLFKNNGNADIPIFELLNENQTGCVLLGKRLIQERV